MSQAISSTMIPALAESEQNPESIDEEFPQDEPERDERVAGIGAWLVSLAIHAVVLALLVLVYFASRTHDHAAVRATVIEPPPDQVEPPKERELIEQVKTTIEVEEVVEEAVVTDLDLEVEELETEDEEISEVAQAKGREEAVSTSEAGGVAAFMAIGAGGGAAGAFGNRQGGGRKNAVGRFGGSRASESAVEAALRWFARHQSPNGMWDLDAYPQNCQVDGPKCEPGALDGSIVINKVDDKQHVADVAVSSYALLCFLGAGYDHKTPNKWRRVVKGGIDWLLAAQQADGLLGESSYEHAIAAMALAEAYGMTHDPALREPAQRSIDMVLQRQTRSNGYGLGWDYFKPNPNRNDSSVTGWNVMALKSGKAAGLAVGDGMDGAKVWLKRAWKASNPDWENLDAYEGESIFPYTWNSTNDRVQKQNVSEDLACVGALCAVFLGKRQGDVLLETLANHIMAEQVPDAYPCETYFLYYNTLAIFQLGGERWKVWNNQVRDMLVESQRNTQDCFDGSWDEGTHTTARWGQRMLATAYCTLSLEVYYRYLPVALQKP